MTLILYRVPEYGDTATFCKKNFEQQLNLSSSSLSKYLPIQEAFLLYQATDFWQTLTQTTKIDGFQVNGKEIYIHPDKFTNQVAGHFKRLLRKVSLEMKPNLQCLN